MSHILKILKKKSWKSHRLFNLNLILLLSFAGWFLFPREIGAIPAWSRKYKESCTSCHSNLFARLNYDGERFLFNGYQNPDSDVPDGDKTGKQQIGDRLVLDKDLGHWLTARLNLTPIQVETNAQVMNKEVNTDSTVTKYTTGNTNWLQIFVAGTIFKNVSIYIENEFEQDKFHIAWYYMGFHNLFGTKLLNLHIGRVSSVVMAAYNDRLPQLPAVAGGVMRIKTSDGKGEASVDIRSPRYGIQYYGYTGPFVFYTGASPGSKPNHPGGIENIGYWGGIRVFVPEEMFPSLEGSSIGLHYMKGVDTKYSTKNQIKNNYTRIMPNLNLRFGDKVDIQGAYVRANEDNWTLVGTLSQALVGTLNQDLEFSGVRAVGSYILNDQWAVSAHYDSYSSDDGSLLKEDRRVYFPVITYFLRENWRMSLYPSVDLRDIPDSQKKHVFLMNIRVGF